MYSWLRRRCEGCSVAEISILQSLAGVISLLFVFVFSYPFGPVVWLSMLGGWAVFMLWFLARRLRLGLLFVMRLGLVGLILLVLRRSLFEALAHSRFWGNHAYYA